MAQNEDPYAYSVIQNLKDAGCTDEMVEKFMALQECGGREQQLRLLSGHRKHLLEKLHRDERRIDCLDYLIYQMEKKKMKMNVNVNGQDFTATLENNSAVDALVQMMESGPVTLQLSDYAGFEARASLPATDRPRPMPGILCCTRVIRSSCSMVPTPGATQGLVISMTSLAG